MNPEIMSFQYSTGMCLLLENVGASEQNRSVANVQSDDLCPSPISPIFLHVTNLQRRAGRLFETARLRQTKSSLFL